MYPLDELEKFEADRVQEVVSRHGIEKYLENRVEQAIRRDLSIVKLVLETYAVAEVFECSFPSRQRSCWVLRETVLTEFEVLLWTRHELRYPRVKAFGEDEKFASEGVVLDEKAQHLNEM